MAVVATAANITGTGGHAPRRPGTSRRTYDFAGGPNVQRANKSELLLYFLLDPDVLPDLLTNILLQ